MSELQTALSLILHELENGEDIIDALDLAAQVIRDDRNVAAFRVDLTKPVPLVKRPRAGEGWTPRPWRERIDYVKQVGKHAASYHPANERYSGANCVPATPQGECPQCNPLSYAAWASKHAYQINMF